MKKGLFIFALFTLLSAGVQAQQQSQQCRLDTTYDRFTSTSTVSTPLEYLTSPIGVLFRSTVGESTNIKMILARGGQTFGYLDCHSVSILKDGERVNLSFEYNPSVSSDGESVSEIWTASISLNTLCQLSRAERVEYRICSGDGSQVSGPVLCSARLICEMFSKRKNP